MKLVICFSMVILLLSCKVEASESHIQIYSGFDTGDRKIEWKRGNIFDIPEGDKEFEGTDTFEWCKECRWKDASTVMEKV